MADVKDRGDVAENLTPEEEDILKDLWSKYDEDEE